MAIVEDIPDESEPLGETEEIPLKHPSEVRKRAKGKTLLDPPASTPSTSAATATMGNDEGEEGSEYFDTALITVPFVFLYILLDILVHLQYQHRPSLAGLGEDLLKAIPTLGIIVYTTTKYASHGLTNPLMMSASIISGYRLIWLVNHASWSVVTAQAPAMGTIWILTIVQLPLSRALVALIIVAVGTWWSGLKVMP